MNGAQRHLLAGQRTTTALNEHATESALGFNLSPRRPAPLHTCSRAADFADRRRPQFIADAWALVLPQRASEEDLPFGQQGFDLFVQLGEIGLAEVTLDDSAALVDQKSGRC